MYALIFLFKWVGNADPATMDGNLQDPPQDHYFASVPPSLSLPVAGRVLFVLTNVTGTRSHQVINNACASIALLNAALNIRDPNVTLGDELTNLQAFSEGARPLERVGSLSFPCVCSRPKLTE